MNSDYNNGVKSEGKVIHLIVERKEIIIIIIMNYNELQQAQSKFSE